MLAIAGCIAVIVTDPLIGSLAPGPSPETIPPVRMDVEIMGRALVGADSIALSEAQAEQNMTGLLEPLGTLDELLAEEPSFERSAALATYVRVSMLRMEVGDIDAARSDLELLAASDTLPATLPQDVQTIRDILAGGADAVPSDRRDLLVEHHGWPGRVAIAFGVSDTDPARQRIESDGGRAFGVLVVVGFGAIIAFAAGLLLFVLGSILFFTGRITPVHARLRPDPTSAVSRIALETFVLFIFCFALFKILGTGLAMTPVGASPAFGIVIYIAQWMLALTMLWPLARGMRMRDIAPAFALGRGRGVIHETVMGFLAYLAGLPIFVGAVLFMLVLVWVTGISPSHPVTDRAGGAGVLDALLLLSMVALWAPIVEEMVFRGALLHHTQHWAGAIGASLITGFIFAAIHPQGFVAIPPLMALGFNFALMRIWRGSLIAPMVAHAIHNSVLVTMLLLLLS
ncbi:MAG: type II CAAX endopeptidase family protein [Planctomycetota bacterium]